MLTRQRAIEIVPSSKPLRWRRYDVPQHLAPETSDALRFCAVEGDLDLLDRRHRSTLGGSFVVSTGPPLARLRRVRPTLEDEWDLDCLALLWAGRYGWAFSVWSVKAESRRTRRFRAPGSAAHRGSAWWHLPRRRRPASRTPVRSLRHGSSGLPPP